MIVNLIGFVSTIVLSRLLFPADFGLVAIAVAVQAIVGSVTELSTASALIRHDDPQDAHFDSVFTLNILRAGFICLLLFGSAHAAASLYNDERLVDILYVLGLSALIGGFFNPKTALFARELRFAQEFVLAVPQKLVGLVVALAIALLYQSYWALIIGGVAAQFAGLLTSYLLLPYRPRFSLVHGREFMGFSVWIGLERAVGALNQRAAPLLIGYALGNAQLGYFAFGDNLAGLPTREATAPVSGVFLPAFSKVKSDKAVLRDTYQRAQALLCAIALPVGFGFAAIAHPLILLAVGDKWLPSVIVVQVLAGVFAIDMLWAGIWPVALALGETQLLFRREVINTSIRLPLIIAGLSFGALVGVLVARTVSSIVIFVLNMVLVRTLLDLPVRRQLAANGRTIGATAVMVMGLALLQQSIDFFRPGAVSIVSLALLTLVGAVLYGATVLALWIRAGRPAGPEETILSLLNRVLQSQRVTAMSQAVFGSHR
ncbi:O-antigen/teichoic acid export membrane protein [Polymorphobacter fuscus]|nr:O-antigen/teichoic acid export membrane protein [Polymorphobacter fuscus]